MSLTPTTVKIEELAGDISWESLGLADKNKEERLEQVRKIVTMAGDESSPVLVCWNGHEFETGTARLYYQTDAIIVGIAANTDEVDDVSEYLIRAYYPIDPRTTEKDWKGCRKAIHNEDGTAWLPYWDKDQHIDHEFALQAAVTTVFERQMHILHKALRTATYNALLSSTSDSRDAFGAASRAYGYLGDFREDVKAEVLREARTKHKGFMEQNPHEAHVHDPVERAILAVGTEWVDNKQTIVWQSIQAQVGFILAAAQKEHPYEDRWVREVEAPRRGEDPVAGYEWCYTAVTSRQVIEGHDNLPDPNWNFDHLRNGQVIRGNYTYTDGEPRVNAFLFLAIRFRRPIPEGTRPGQDIGRVEWEQSEAYLIPTRT